VTLGQYIRRKRQRRGDTQEQAAKHVKVNVLTWGRWERGQLPTLAIAFRLADYLGCRLDKLRRYVEQTN
jgi:transcriptional regulator with XRE-family HTH domain